MQTEKKVIKANSLQIVNIEHNKFAVELMNGNVSVNLTQMAKSFGKKPKDWLRTDDSESYIQKIAKRLKCPLADLVTVRHGGTPGLNGTWTTDRRIAIRFAQWLDTDLAIAVDELLIKLITGSAVVAEPIGGVWPIVYNGEVGYPRKEILQAAGYSFNSGNVSRLKKTYPNDNFTLCRITCLSPRLARLKIEQGKVRQLSLSFRC